MKNKMIFLIAILVLSLFYTPVYDSNILMASIGSNSFTVALIGVLGAILLRGGDKK